MRLRRHQDAFGQALLDAHEGRDANEFVERDDGYIDHSAAGHTYLPRPEGPGEEALATLREARGRVLDVGCGAGRFAVALQNMGHDVLGIDISPLAIRVARERGLRQGRVLDVSEVGPRLGVFGTIVMLGNNFGVLSNPGRARTLLRRFHRITAPDGRILAQSLDVYQTKDPDHLAYHRLNRRRSRMPGQIRMRIRHRRLKTPWFDYLMVSPDEMRRILDGTGWTLTRIIAQHGPSYTALIEKR